VAGRLIVVIDDDVDTCDAFADWLEYGGDEVVCAANAQAAETRLAGRAPVACILDLQLGGKTGLDVFRELRGRLPSFRDTVPIVLTGMHPARAQQVIEAAEMAPLMVLTKPIDPDQLVAMIDRAIGQRR
jgi:two-component system OmpR family response regulator